MRETLTDQPRPDRQRQAHVFVRGQVQGVGYRAFVIRSAGRLQLVGTVRNLRDGSVEVIAEGGAEPLAELLAELQKGPWGAQVDELETTWGHASGQYSSFGVSFANGRAGGGYR